MTAYLVGKLVVKNWDWYNDYRSLTEQLIAEHGGHYLVKGGKPEKLEGNEAAAHACVVVAFPNREAAVSWYEDPRYAAMKDLRNAAGVETNLVLVDGFE